MFRGVGRITWKTWKGHVIPGFKERFAGFPFPLAAPRAKYKPPHVFASGLVVALIFPSLSVQNLRPYVSYSNRLDSKYYIIVGLYKVYE